jgi:type I restriction enzyme R subunit
VIEKEFNDRHGTNFAEAEMTRLEQVNRSIMSDDLSEMLRNNPPNVAYTALS